jgi:hypothetical protein
MVGVPLLEVLQWMIAGLAVSRTSWQFCDHIGMPVASTCVVGEMVS